MASYSRIEAFLQMKESGILPIFYHPDPSICRQVIHACYEGGCRIFEITNRGDGALDLFKELLSYSKRELPGLMLGVGSIMDPATCSLYIQVGANFIVSPILNPDMARVCNRNKILWVPGCGTASEISQAEELGAEIVKIFPADTLGGADFVKAIKGPMRWTNIIPTGGVSPEEEDLRTWFGAGVTCVGMGGNLLVKKDIESRNWTAIRDRMAKALDIVHQIRA